MSKNRKHLMRSSLIMLIVAAVSLSSATYAWFTSGNTGAVTGIEFSAQTSDGILISADAMNWSSTVTAAQIKAAQTSNLKGKMCACSSAGTVSTAAGTKGQLQLYTTNEANKTSGVTVTGAAVATETANGFYTFDLYFKNDGSTAKKISLITDYSTESTKSSVTDGTGTDEDKDTSNAVRVAFVDEGVGAETSQTPTSVKAANGGTTSTIWEPNAKTHGAYALSYRFAITDDGTLPTTPVSIAADTAYKYLALDKAAASTVGLEVVNGAITASKDTSTDDYTKLMAASSCPATLDIAENIPAGKIEKITVYIWIEGQDVDCNNAEAAGKVITNLQFKATDLTA